MAGVVLDAGGRPMVPPALPGLRLWADALDKLAWPGRMPRRMRPALEKYLGRVDELSYHDPSCHEMNKRQERPCNEAGPARGRNGMSRWELKPVTSHSEDLFSALFACALAASR